MEISCLIKNRSEGIADNARKTKGGTRISNSFKGLYKREPIERDQAAELLQVNEINKTSTNVFHNDDIIETYSQIKSEIEAIKMRDDF